jgi:hypothetical protein
MGVTPISIPPSQWASFSDAFNQDWVNSMQPPSAPSPTMLPVPTVAAPTDLLAGTPYAQPGIPGTGGVGGIPAAGGGGLFSGGFGMDEAKLALGGLQTIGQLWGAFQAAKMAKKQFNFTKDITETNLANQIRSYNTQLEDRSRSRAVVEGQSAAEAQAYIDRNKAVRR